MGQKMVRPIVLVALLGVLAGVIRPASAQSAATSNPQADLQREVDAATASLDRERATARETIARLQRLVLGYRSLGPYVSGFGTAEYALNRALARRSLSWLGQTSVWYLNDPLAARAYLDAYDAIGGFYRDARFYGPGAYVAYAGGARLARRLMLGTPYDWAIRDLDRYALAYGTMVTLDGRLVGQWTTPQDLSESLSAPIAPLELPKVDRTTLSAAQGESWDDVRIRFRSVASQVHASRVLLDQLSSRLRFQGQSLHPANAAIAMKMQGYLEDASELIVARDFDTAIEALRRADYERSKLKGVTGQ